MTEIKSYRDPQVWQRAIDFAINLYGVTDSFPNTEDYGLTGQMRRAVVSIASNIAEGHTRPGREFGRFIGIALGSLAELETQLEISHRIGYIAPDDFARLEGELSVIGKQLNVFIPTFKTDRIRGFQKEGNR